MAREVIESEEYKGHKIDIVPDESPMDPRTDWEPMTEIHVRDCRYYLGEHKHQDSTEIAEVVRQAKQQGDLVFRLFAYIHSGTVLSLQSFQGRLPQGHAEFDSGQCGVVIFRRKTFFDNWGGKKWTAKRRAKAEEIAKGEIQTFTNYLNGAVYCYLIDDGEDSCGGDSCGGFYGGTDEAMSEAKSVVDTTVKQETKDHIKQVKVWIQNGVPLQYRVAVPQTDGYKKVMA